MSKLIRHRWLRRVLGLAALLALGVGIYRLEEPAPRWGIDTDRPAMPFLADHGKRLVTVQVKSNAVTIRQTRKSDGKTRQTFEATWRSRVRLHVTDIDTGTRLASFFDDDTVVLASAQSNDGRFYAAETCSIAVAEAAQHGKHVLLRIDLIEDKVLEIPLGDTPVNTTLTFSKDGKLLARVSEKHHQEMDDEPKRLEVFDTQTGIRLHDLASMGLQSPEHFSDGFLLHDKPSPKGEAAIEAFNPRTGARLFSSVSTRILISPDGGYLLCADQPHGEKSIPWTLWNMRTFAREGKVLLSDPGYFSLDGRRFVDYAPAGEFLVRELPSGRQVGTVPFLGRIFTLCFSPDSRHLAVVYADGPALALFELPTLKMLWTQASDDAVLPLHFGPDSKTLFALQAQPRELHAYECANGNLLYRLALPRSPNGFDMPLHQMAADQSAILILEPHGVWSIEKVAWWPRIRAWLPWLSRLPEAKNDIVVVLDSTTSRERFRLQGWNAQTAVLSDDGNTVVTTHTEAEDRHIIRCWNVNAWKPLHWPIGVPAGLATLFVIVGCWRTRRSKRSTPTEPRTDHGDFSQPKSDHENTKS